MTYPIEKGIPMPAKQLGKPRRFPTREMKIGDSFLVPAKEAGKHVAHSIRNCARYCGIKVTVRQVKGGVRAWRVS